MFDAIVVGSGAAGTFAARGMRGKNVLVLDVGFQETGRSLPAGHLYDLRKQNLDLFGDLIGEEFESLNNLHASYLSPKLKSPRMRFVVESPSSASSFTSSNFMPVTSHARGGLTNAWGAGCLRFNQADLRGFPFQLGDIEPYYDELTSHIGINGQSDDLSDYFGSLRDLLPPLRLSSFADEFVRKYHRHKDRFQRGSLRLGRTRAAILTKDLGGRKKYEYSGQEFFQPNLSCIYHTGYTLADLVSQGEITYLPGYEVLRFQELSDRVVIAAKNLKTGLVERFEARQLLLAAGVLNTSKIVLLSCNDTQTRLPILDNPVSFVPFISPGRIGSPLDVHSFSGGELILLYEGDLYPSAVQASFYGLVAPLRSDLIMHFPLSISGNLAATKYLIPALGMLQIFYPDEPEETNFLKLNETGGISLSYVPKALGVLEGHILRVLRSIGYFGFKRQCQYPSAGSSIHYAGTLPMRGKPECAYQTDASGLLFGSQRVTIADASTFPRLPAKNLTFTIMANAMRVAKEVLKKLP